MASSIQTIKREIVRERERLVTAKKLVADLKEEIAEIEATFPENESQEHPKETQLVDYKSKYEHQAECNRKLSREIEEMKKRVQFEKRKSKMSSQTSDDEFYGAQGKRLMIRLQREKINLESQMRDSEWKLDEEARTFHKVDEKRKQLIRDVQRAGGNVGQILANAGGGPGSISGRRESKTLESIPEFPLLNAQRRASIKEQPATNKRSPSKKATPSAGFSSDQSKPQTK